jgi:hypothetical protein
VGVSVKYDPEYVGFTAGTGTSGTKEGVTSIPREHDQSDRQRSVDLDYTVDLREFLARSAAEQRSAVEAKYGPDVRGLADDYEKLLTYVESNDPSQKAVAFSSLLYFHTIYSERIVRAAADYIVNGGDLRVRGLCVRYLGSSANVQIISTLRDCVNQLTTSEAKPGDSVIIQIAKLGLSEREPVADLPPAASFHDVEKAAREILERLQSKDYGNRGDRARLRVFRPDESSATDPGQL